MTADLSAFEQLAKRGPDKCIVGRALDRLDKQEAANLTAALAASHLPHRIVAKWMRDREVGGSDMTVRAHRNGECCCGR